MASPMGKFFTLYLPKAKRLKMCNMEISDKHMCYQSAKYHQLSYSRCVILLSLTLLLNFLFPVSQATAANLTIKGKGDKYTFKVTGVIGYRADEAKKTMNMGMFGNYIASLESAETVEEKGMYGVANMTVDAGEALVLKVSEVIAGEGEALTLRKAFFKKFTADDVVDILVYDYSANRVIFTQFGCKASKGNSFKFKGTTLEKDDLIVLGAGVSRTSSWSFGRIQASVSGKKETRSQIDNAILSAITTQISEKDFYYTGIDGEKHLIKTFFPEGDEKNRSCAVFFHGGGWSGGSYTQFVPLCKYLAGRGMVSITADYTVFGSMKAAGQTLPEGHSRKRNSVIDAKSVIRWVKQNAAKLGIDPNRIIAGGGSAGGHIATLAMVDHKYNNPKDPQEFDTNLQALVLLCPAFIVAEEKVAEDVNVFRNIDKKFPPVLLLVGEFDGWKKASDELANQLKARGGNVHNWMAPGCAHMFFVTQGAWLAATANKIDEYLVAKGLLSGSSSLKSSANGEKLIKLN